MQLEQIRDKAYSDAIRRVPNPSFGASIHEYGETEQEVLKSIDDRFRDEVARLLAMIQEIQIPSEAIFEESQKQYKWHQVMKVSALRLIEDVLKEHNCGCSIHICGKDRLKLMVYGKIEDDMNDIFTIHTNLKNIRNDLIARLGSH